MAPNRKFPSIKNNSEFVPASRRDLLKTLSLAGLAASAPASLACMPAEAEPAPADPRRAKYQETEHIRTFYAFARR
jgi:hypothetical protein